MSEMFDGLQEAFSEIAAQAGATLTGPNALTCDAIATPLLKSKLLRDSGLMPEVESTAEILRTDMTRLEIVDRALVVIGGVTFKVMLIEDDGADPCVRLHLKRSR